MFGNRKTNKWTKEEEEALLAGIAKHGAGNWKVIVADPDFAAQLKGRTNNNLKDKWRNLSYGATSIKEETKNESWCNAIVFEALSTINGEKGSDFSGILKFIEERHEVPLNFRKLLSNSLRLLVSQEKLEKLRNRYKISNRIATEDSVVSTTSEETYEIDSAVEAAANEEPKRIKDFAEEINFLEWREEPQSFKEFVSEILTVLISQGKLDKNLYRHKISEIEKKLFEVAPEIVAAKLAESDYKSLIAAEAVKEAQQVQKLAEESQLMLELCLEIHEECALGKRVLLR